MLQSLRLAVHLIPAVTQRLVQVQLQEPVVADHLEGHPLARRGQGDAAIGGMVHEPQRRQLLHHLGDRPRRDPQPLRQRRGAGALVLLAEQEDRLQGVFDSMAEFIAQRELRVFHSQIV